MDRRGLAARPAAAKAGRAAAHGTTPARRLDAAGRATDGSRVAAGTAEVRAALPAPLAEALAGYEEHLRAQRDLSAHTVRGYVTDVVTLLDHLARRGGRQVHDLDLAALRSWLAQGRTRGHSRATTARHAAAARSFTGWLRRAGLTPDDVGLAAGQPEGAPHPARRARPRPGARGRRVGRRAPRNRSGCATPSSSSCSTPAASGSASSSASTSTTSTAAAGCCGCSARGARSAACPTASRPSGRSTPG